MSLVLTPSTLHEFYAARESDGAAASGVGMALAGLDRQRSILWVRHGAVDREIGAPYGPGLAEYGQDPGRVVLLAARDPMAALQAGLEGARTAGLAAVAIELWGEAKAYDLTASRRLVLAARTSGTLVLVTRIAAEPRASAAETRWRLTAAPSRALPARAPGAPAFDLTLLRARDGREGLRLLVEWNRDERRFVARDGAVDADLAAPSRRGDGAAPSGAVVAVSFDRSDPGPNRRTG